MINEKSNTTKSLSNQNESNLKKSQILIKILCIDNKIIELEQHVAKMFQTLKTMIEDSEKDDCPIKLNNISSQTLERMVEYAKYHLNDPVLSEDEISKERRKTSNITGWDLDFISKFDQNTIFELIVASNFLDLRGLLDLTCKFIANSMKGKTVEEIRKQFNIKNDFTFVEEQKLKGDNIWAENYLHK